MALVIVLNEFILRNGLPQYAATPEKLWSLIVLTLNAKAPDFFGQYLIFLFPILACCYAAIFTQLPKWGQQLRRNLKSGLPSYEDYGKIYFFIDTDRERVAFYLWHSVLMRISFLFAVIIPCMGINLFRSFI